MSHEIPTLRQAADMLQLNEDTLRVLARHRKVPAMKVGRQWRFDEGLLRDWVRERSLNSLATPASACATATKTSARRGRK